MEIVNRTKGEKKKQSSYEGKLKRELTETLQCSPAWAASAAAAAAMPFHSVCDECVCA